MVETLKKLIRREDLTSEEASHAMTEIMTGTAGEIRTGAFLTAMSMKGETGVEIEAFARSMRHAAVAWPGNGSGNLCDTCGTGGDSAGTINVSTLSALLLATMGHRVAKHGNRAVSSSTGSADLLESLGISLEQSHENAAASLERVGITFLFAPAWHPAMKYAAPVRKSLGIRTFFNLLGPITNPAPITHQVVGVFDRKFIEPVARALAGFGRNGAYVLHSADGLDELSLSDETYFIRIMNGAIHSEGSLSPEDFGYSRRPLSELIVKTREEAIGRAREILAGRGSDAENEIISMNSALIHAMINGVDDLKSAAEESLQTLKSGRCLETVLAWSGFQNEAGSVMAGGQNL
jgi:anthranilate phosphoribosyltransferase